MNVGGTVPWLGAQKEQIEEDGESLPELASSILLEQLGILLILSPADTRHQLLQPLKVDSHQRLSRGLPGLQPPMGVVSLVPPIVRFSASWTD